jgi:protein arginine N-methyltransferase 1
MPHNRSEQILSFHNFLLTATSVRLENYRRAIFESVRPGDVVLDLGCGTGILSFLACQAGARKVYGIEMGEVAELARLLSLKNGFADRVVFLNDVSHRVNLPEPADVLVTDTFGTFGLQDGGLRSVVDARKRLLKEDGVIVPRVVELFVAPVEFPEFYRKEIDSWTQELHRLDLSAVRSFSVNNLYPTKLDQKTFLADPAPAARLQLTQLENADVQFEVCFTANRSGLLHGLGGWFVAELTKDIFLSNGPNITTTNYAQTFFPVEHPIPLDAGDRLKVAIHSYDSSLWRWQVEIAGGGASKASAPKANFDQSTFLGFPMSRERLLKQALSYAPKLSSAGAAELLVLNCFNGKSTIEEIERDLISRFPDEYKTQSDAADFVREVVKRCA